MGAGDALKSLRNVLRGGRTISGVQLMTERGNGFYEFDGALYQSDIIRAAIRPKVKAIGKLTAKHIRETISPDGARKLQINPEPYMRYLLEEPNPIMTGQVFREKLAAQLALNNNAFAVIVRDEAGYPMQLWPVPASGVDALFGGDGDLYLRFMLANGRAYTFRYSDVIHLRDDFCDNDIFGTSKVATIVPLLNVISTIDQGIVKAIRNGAVIRWLLKFHTGSRPEDIEAATKQFAKSFLSVENSAGVAGVNTNADAVQVNPHDYVPNAVITDNTHRRLYEALNTNTKIVDSSRTENEWNSYFDAEIEPVLLQMQGEFTRKLFSRKERGFGNSIVFEASNWDSASVGTKLQLSAMVDRGALTPNEWRATFNLAPVPGGDEPIRRLDTAPTANVRTEGGDA